MNFDISKGNLQGVVRSSITSNTPKINFTVSTNHSTTFTLNRILDMDDSESHWASQDDPSLNNWLQIKFMKQPFVVKYYTLCSYTKGWHLTKWSFQASKNGVSWIDLDDRPLNNDLSTTNAISYPVSNCRMKGYQYYRFKQTAQSNAGDNIMRISRFDLFGILTLR